MFSGISGNETVTNWTQEFTIPSSIWLTGMHFNIDTDSMLLTCGVVRDYTIHLSHKLLQFYILNTCSTEVIFRHGLIFP